jgi:hypothetical protein
MSKVVNNFAGLNGFIWWVGAVEDFSDPLGIGRCKVRIFGWYGEQGDIPTSDLPWAHPMLPINNSACFDTPRIGDWVVGFFMDSESGQFPIMMGVLPGIVVTDPASPMAQDSPTGFVNSSAEINASGGNQSANLAAGEESGT